MNRKIRINLTDSHTVFRKALKILLTEVPQFSVVSESCNGKELLSELKRTDIDVVLLEVRMPVMDGREALRIIDNRFRQTRVIILTSENGCDGISELMVLGANAYLHKSCLPETLFAAITAVSEQGYFFDQSSSKAMLNSLIRDRGGDTTSDEVIFNSRETEILRLICDGRTNKEIAVSLNLSPSTIDFYKTKFYSKIKCNNVAGLMRFALKKGLIELT